LGSKKLQIIPCESVSFYARGRENASEGAYPQLQKRGRSRDLLRNKKEKGEDCAMKMQGRKDQFILSEERRKNREIRSDW